ncbi:MAG TPA: DMT family transporter [Burkholderiales bacterium]|nr:DMT family transporter [Burkholderiales bacterium]
MRPAGEVSALRGILAMVAGAGLLTLNDAVSKHLAHDYPVGQVVCLRQLAAMAFILPYALATGGAGSLAAVNRGGQLLRAALFAAGTGLIVWSLKLLPLSLVTVILFSSPFFVAAVSAPLLGERVSARQWGAIAAGFAGVLLIVRPAGGGYEWAALLPVAAALSNAVRDAVTRRLARTDSSISILFWSGVMVAAAGLATVPWGWRAVDLPGAAWFLAAGFLNAAAHFMVIEAFRLGRAATVAPFRYTGILWAMLVGFLAWGESPDAWMLAGAAVVIASGIYMIRRAQ